MKTKYLKTAISKNAGYGVYCRKNWVNYYHNANSYEQVKEKYFKTEKMPNDLKTSLIFYLILSTILYVFINLFSKTYTLIPASLNSYEIVFYGIASFILTLLANLGTIWLILLVLKCIKITDPFTFDRRKLKGADNMLHSAYKRLGRIPTFDEIKQESCFKRFSPDAIVMMISFAIYLVVSAYNNNVVPLYFFAAAFIIFSFITHLSVLQILDTDYPDDETINFVLSAVNESIL